MTELVCSAKACRNVAVWAVQWRNPRIHDETRRKVWTACEDHRDWLQEFLLARSFPVTVVPLSESPGPA